MSENNGRVEGRTILINSRDPEEEIKRLFSKYGAVRVRKSGPIYTFIEFDNFELAATCLQEIKNHPNYEARYPKEKPIWKKNIPSDNRERLSLNSSGFENEKRKFGPPSRHSFPLNDSVSKSESRNGFSSPSSDKVGFFPRGGLRAKSSKEERPWKPGAEEPAKGKTDEKSSLESQEKIKKVHSDNNKTRTGEEKVTSTSALGDPPRYKSEEKELEPISAEAKVEVEKEKVVPNNLVSDTLCNGITMLQGLKESENDTSISDTLDINGTPKEGHLVFIKDIVDFEKLKREAIGTMVGVVVANFPIYFMQCDVYTLCNPFVKVLHVEIRNNMTPLEIPFAYVFVASDIIADHLVKMVNMLPYKGKQLLAFKVSDIAEEGDILPSRPLNRSSVH